MEEIVIGGTYKHFKGNIYKVIALGKHSETCEDMVIYQSLAQGGIWCRPAKMWNEKINDSTTRFTLIDDGV